MPYKDPAVRKAKQAEYSKIHYEKNKKELIRKINVRKKIHKAWFVDYKKQLSCINCGEDHPATLDFHHVTPINTNQKVHKLLSDGNTKTRILKEIAKCVVLCSNCHRKHHHDERQEKKQLALAKI
jgi:phage FluMu gp28-like protein